MLTTSRSETSFFGLVRELKDETQALIKEEVALAKTEMSEKMSCYVRNGVSVAIGGFVAYAGAIVLFLGLGSLLGYWFTTMDMAPHLAFGLGWGGMGIIVVAIGAVMVLRALKTFASSSLAPEKTIETIHELKGDHAQYLAKKELEKIPTPNNGHKRTSDEIKASVETTQKMMGDTVEELKHRFTPKYMGKSLVAGVKHHPGRTAVAGAVVGLLSFALVRWRMHRHHAAELARLAELNMFQRWREKLRQTRDCRRS